MSEGQGFADTFRINCATVSYKNLLTSPYQAANFSLKGSEALLRNMGKEMLIGGDGDRSVTDMQNGNSILTTMQADL
jgi:hypothetical protein